MLWPSCFFIIRKGTFAQNFVNKNSVNSVLKLMSSDASVAEVLFEKSKEVGVIQLNRPKALNALNLNMVRLMNNKLKEWETDGTKLIICKGSGQKAFCAGGDIVEIYKAGKARDSLASEFFKQEYVLDNQIAALKPSYVALVNGITMGGGVGISVHGKFRVATEKTVFAMPETAIGFLTDVGGSYFLPRLQDPLGVYLALTGNRIVGNDVKLAGIATHFVNSTLVDNLESELLLLPNPDDISVGNLLSSFEVKSASVSTNSESSKTSTGLQEQLPLIRRHFHKKSVEAIIDSLRQDGSDWSIKVLDTLDKMSPSSLKIVFRLIHEGKSKSLPQCLAMEYRVSQKILQRNDFYEGVRSKLVDKDNRPTWKPTKLEDISDKDVDFYFLPFSNACDELQIK